MEKDVKKINIAIVDDHPLVINGMENMLRRYPSIALLATYSSGAALLEGLERQVPDVLLLDIQLPDQTGDQLAPLVLKKYPQLKILTLTNFDSTLYVENMLRHGVQGYILKTAEEKDLILAIECIYNGDFFMDTVLKAKMEYTANRVLKRTTSRSTLTQRENEILQLLVNGNTCPQIAEQLFLSVNTVVNYRASIMLKLEVGNTALLVKKALMLGLAH